MVRPPTSRRSSPAATASSSAAPSPASSKATRSTSTSRPARRPRTRSAGERTPTAAGPSTPGATADYRTRIIVRRPKDAADVSGTVLVEWMNVSGGVDADPEFATLREEIVRRAHLGGRLRPGHRRRGRPGRREGRRPRRRGRRQGPQGDRPERYGALEHPGDAYAFDIYTQVARAVREAAGARRPQPARWSRSASRSRPSRS